MRCIRQSHVTQIPKKFSLCYPAVKPMSPKCICLPKEEAIGKGFLLSLFKYSHAAKCVPHSAAWTHIAAEVVNIKRRLGRAHHSPLRWDRNEPGVSSASPWWPPDTALATLCAAYLCEER